MGIVVGLSAGCEVNILASGSYLYEIKPKTDIALCIKYYMRKHYVRTM